MAKKNQTRKKPEIKVQSKLSNGIIIAILIFLPAFVYFPVLNHSFVWDDEPLYINRTNFPADNVFNNYAQFWVPDSSKMYSPVTYTFWAVGAWLSNDKSSTESSFKPAIFHFFNLLFHILNGMIIFYILLKLSKEKIGALFGALIFMLHPIQVESVAWVSELRGLLAAFFGFLSILFFINFRQIGKEINHENKGNPLLIISISVMFFIMSLLSKPTGLVFGILILLIDIGIIKSTWKDSLKVIFPYFIFAIPILLITSSSESSAGRILNYPAWQTPLMVIDTVYFYITKVLFPFNLTPGYGRTAKVVMDWIFISIPFVILIILYTIYLGKKKKALLSTSIIIFLVGYFPVSNIIPFYYQYWSNVADRYIYISMLGAAMFAAFLFIHFNKHKSLMYVLSVLTGVYLIMSLLQVPIWKNEFTLWNDAIEKYPESSPHLYTARGLIYLEQQKFNEAISDFTEAIKLNTKDARNYYNRANAYLDAGNFEKAIYDYSVSIKLNPNLVNTYINRAMAYDAAGKLDSAISDYTKAIGLNPEQSDIYFNRGNTYARAGNFTEAANNFKRAFELNPSDTKSKLNYEEAIKEIDKSKK